MNATVRLANAPIAIVVEQDPPATGQELGAILADQQANRELLGSVGL